MTKQIITADDVRNVTPGGELVAPLGSVVTSWAQEIADSRGVRIVLRAVAAPKPEAPRALPVAVGADHGGFAFKEDLKTFLQERGLVVRDLGTFSRDAVDYPDIAHAVARTIRSGEAGLGILIDGAGIGSAMAANKVPGVRAALCVDAAAARNAREHNDANVLTMGAGWLDPTRLREIVSAFLDSRITEERHVRRVAKIRAIEESWLR